MVSEAIRSHLKKVIKNKSLLSRVAQSNEGGTFRILLEEKGLVERLYSLLSKYDKECDIRYLIDMASIHERLADIEEEKVASLKDSAELNREMIAALESFEGR